MRNKKYRIAVAFLSALLVLGGCKGEQEGLNETREEDSVVTIPVMFRMDPQSNEGSNVALVDAFNKAYEGKYRVEVEWLVETENGYRTKLKQLNATDKLPAVITDVGFDVKFLQLLIDSDRLVNLEPYFSESEEWQDAMKSGIVEEIREEDGSIYVSPLGNLMYSSAGIVYNKYLLEKAGYTKFPDSWDDLMECLLKLKYKGIVPLSLHGAGNYWVPMLFSTAYCSAEEEGKAFLKEKFPDSYQNESMRRTMEFMKQLYSYSYADALEIEYADAESRFLSGDAAMIANGPWMFMGLSDEEKEKFGFVDFPGDVLVGSWEMTAWAAVNTYSEEVQRGAVEFLKFRTLKDLQDVEADINSMDDSKEGGIMEMYQNRAWNAADLVPNYQINWDQRIINDYMITCIPEYVKGGMELDEFLAGMDEEAKRIRESE